MSRRSAPSADGLALLLATEFFDAFEIQLQARQLVFGDVDPGTIASARADVRDEQRDLAHVDAVESQRIADTHAQGEYKVALAQCEALSGATQQSCKDQANADYAVSRATAKQAKASADPKP